MKKLEDILLPIVGKLPDLMYFINKNTPLTAHERHSAAEFSRLARRTADEISALKKIIEGVEGPGFLNSMEWKRVRMDVLERDGAKCKCCGVSAKNGAVLNVDHIQPRKLRPDLALDKNNLQVLCSVCNAGKGNRYSTDWRDI